MTFQNLNNEEFNCYLKNILNGREANIFLPGGKTIKRLVQYSKNKILFQNHNIYLTDERLVGENNPLHNFTQLQKLIQTPITKLASFQNSSLSINEKKYLDAFSGNKYRLAIVTFGRDGHYAGHLSGSYKLNHFIGLYRSKNNEFRYGLGHKAWIKFDKIIVVFDNNEKQKLLISKRTLISKFIHQYNATCVRVYDN